MRWKLILVSVFLMLMINFACADFVFSDKASSITTEYNVSTYLKANINMSFQNEPLNSSFKDSFGNSINISKLLTKIPSFSYTIDGALKTISSDFHVIPFTNAYFLLPDIPGTFSYQLNLTKRDGSVSTKIFSRQIKISPYSKSIENELKRKRGIISNLETEIKKMEPPTQEMLKNVVNITYFKEELDSIEARYKTASSDEYTELSGELSATKVPEIATETINTKSMVFYPKRENVNFEIVGSITEEGNYTEEKRGEYLDALFLWNLDNLKTNLTFKQISIFYEGGLESDLKIFTFEFDKTNMEEEAYFILEDLEDIHFYEDYSEQEEEGYYYINLEDISDGIIFSTQKEINFIEVPAFISPSLSELTPAGPGTYTEYLKNVKKWILFGLFIFLLLLIAFIAYIVIQTWYRRKYENYLFKNRNNLFNIMHYIQNSKKGGVKREDIRRNLKKAGWKTEQINYALNKYEGKKIAGIIERPFKRVLENIEKHPKK